MIQHWTGLQKKMLVRMKELWSLIQQDMQQHFSNSTWVLQGWQDTPKTDMLKGLDRSKTMVFDLLGDRGENWEKRNGYEQFPWVWCTITNFGGKQFMEGKLMRVLTEPKRASRSSVGSNIKGVGVIPEAIENNEIIYQSILDGAWHLEVPSIQKNISDYTKAIV